MPEAKRVTRLTMTWIITSLTCVAVVAATTAEVIEDTDGAKTFEAILPLMGFIQRQSGHPSPIASNSDWLDNINIDLVSVLYGLVHACGKIPVESKSEVLSWAKTTAKQMALLDERFLAAPNVIEGSEWLMEKVGRGRFVGGLAAATLSYEAVVSLKEWYDGRISGEMCATRIVDTSGSVAGGWAGAVVGATLGSRVCPIVCPLVGGCIGGVFGSWAARKCVSYLTERIFDLPKHEAVKKAHEFFEVKPEASDDEVNAAYCKKAEEAQGESQEKLLELQINLKIVLMDRDRIFYLGALSAIPICTFYACRQAARMHANMNML